MIRRCLIAVAVMACTLSPVAAQADPKTPQVYVIGASVTRLSATSIVEHVGRLVGEDNVHVNAFDGRSLVHDGAHGEPNLMVEFNNIVDQLEPGDWLILETGHGGVTPYQNRQAWRQVVRTLNRQAPGACIAAVAPATHYGPATPETVAWNARTTEVFTKVLADANCSAVVAWGPRVAAMTDIDAGGVGAPLMYDGRHPTPMGGRWYAREIVRAIRGLS